MNDEVRRPLRARCGGRWGQGEKSVRLTADECYDCYNILTLILIP